MNGKRNLEVKEEKEYGERASERKRKRKGERSKRETRKIQGKRRRRSNGGKKIKCVKKEIKKGKPWTITHNRQR